MWFQCDSLQNHTAKSLSFQQTAKRQYTALFQCDSLQNNAVLSRFLIKSKGLKSQKCEISSLYKGVWGKFPQDTLRIPPPCGLRRESLENPHKISRPKSGRLFFKLYLLSRTIVPTTIDPHNQWVHLDGSPVAPTMFGNIEITPEQ